MHSILAASALFIALSTVTAQRITTIQLDGVQYFVSRMNPYSPELNYFLAYQYCRSLGLQLVSFETKEKADSITQYLKNAGYNRFDFWTSGNKLGTNMLLWMSTGLPFNVTFNYMRPAGSMPEDQDMRMESTIPMMAPEVTGRQADGDMGSANGCIALKSPDHLWEIDDCMKLKDFICEQTRCYYYNYGSIPVSTSQGFCNFTQNIYPKHARMFVKQQNNAYSPLVFVTEAEARVKPPQRPACLLSKLCEITGNKIINPNAPHPTERPTKFDEGLLLNFTSTRRVTLRPTMVRKEVAAEHSSEPPTTDASEGEDTDEPNDVGTTLTPDEFHDAVLGKVSRNKAVRMPTVDRLERKISASWSH